MFFAAQCSETRNYRSLSDSEVTIKLARAGQPRRRDSDNASASSSRTTFEQPTPTYRIEVTEASHKTYFAVLEWLLTGNITFARLRSSIKKSHDPSVAVTAATIPAHTLHPAPVSPKSIYKLAELLDLPQLKTLALESIMSQVGTATVAEELLSEVSILYEPVQTALIEFVAKNLKEVLKSEGWKELENKTAGGNEAGSRICVTLLHLVRGA